MQIKASWCAIIAFWCTDSFISALTLLLWLCACWLAGSAVGAAAAATALANGMERAHDKKMCCAPKCAKKGKITTAGISCAEESKIYSHSHPLSPPKHSRDVFLLLFSAPIRVHRGRSNFVPRPIFTQNSVRAAHTRGRAGGCPLFKKAFCHCSEKSLSLSFLC